MRNSDGVYTRADRNGYWITWTDAQGRRRFRKTNVRTLQQARSARAAELVRVEQTKAIGFAPPGKETIEDIASRFLTHQRVRLTPRSYKREDGIVNAQLTPFFTGPVASIRRVDVQRFVTTRAGKVSPHTVVKELNVLKHLLRLCVEWEILPINPAHGVKSPRVPAGRVRYLQPTELRAALAACPDWLRPIAGLAAATGMRRSEILGLRWLDVDLNNARIMLPQTKNGEGRIIYLNQSAIAAVRSVPSNSETSSISLLFPRLTGEHISVAFSRVCKALKIADFRFHDLRHTAASWLRMKGADIHTVAQLLGHKDLRMAARYQHLSGEYLADAVKKLDAVFMDPKPLPPRRQLPSATLPRAKVAMPNLAKPTEATR